MKCSTDGQKSRTSNWVQVMNGHEHGHVNNGPQAAQ